MPAATERPIFFAKLEEETLPIPGRKKRERTLARVRLATAVCLERSGYIGLKAGDISQEAGLSEGSFYVYFDDKRQAATSVLKDFMNVVMNSFSELGGARDAFSAIRNTNRLWVKMAMDHPGLMRSVTQIIDSDPEFAAVYAEKNKRWHEIVARSVLKRYANPKPQQRRSVAFAVIALNAMMDEVARGIFTSGTYTHLLDNVPDGDDGEGLADALSVIWFRTLYPGVEIPTSSSRKRYPMAEMDGRQADLGLDKAEATRRPRRSNTK